MFKRRKDDSSWHVSNLICLKLDAVRLVMVDIHIVLNALKAASEACSRLLLPFVDRKSDSLAVVSGYLVVEMSPFDGSCFSKIVIT